MIPTEHEMTTAVDAAARHLYAAAPQPDLTTGGPLDFDDLHPLQRNQYRETVLGPVVAALEALPDRSQAVRTAVGEVLTMPAEAGELTATVSVRRIREALA